jgi:hypothetical protein
MTHDTISNHDAEAGIFARSPIRMSDLELLKTTLMFTDDDARYLRMSREVLNDQAENVVAAWQGFIGQHPHLLYFFTRISDGQPNMGYVGAIGRRVVQWVFDTADANYDQKWLDHQYEIGRRHHRSAKNRTDNVDTVQNISYRYLPVFVSPALCLLKPFLAKKGHSSEDVEKMSQAWLKAILLHVALWSMPYVKEGDF